MRICVAKFGEWVVVRVQKKKSRLGELTYRRGDMAKFGARSP